MRMFSDYVKKVRASGRSYFTLSQAVKELGVDAASVHSSVKRLKRSGEIISPTKGLYIIVPPENKSFGSLPAEELVPILMRYWKLSYYAGLLTAASYFGASHQKPGGFQVITNKQIKRKLVFGRIRIDFLYKKSLAGLPTQDITVKTGYLIISSPEVTAMDLFLYPCGSGGLNHTATVLSELVEALDPKKLIDLVKKSKQHFWVQRLGYILEKIDTLDSARQKNIINVLVDYMSKRSYTYLPLAPEIPIKGYPRSKRWKIIENAKVESDL